MSSYSPIPEPSLNGGWFTGEPFHKGAEYGNVYVVPSSAYWNSENLKSANPPPQALSQIQNGYRPGNNTDLEIPKMKCPTRPSESTESVCGKGKQIIYI